MNAPKNKTRQILRVLFLCFVLVNIIALIQSYKFTHFAENSSVAKTANPTTLSTWKKLKVLLFGISNPRPTNGDLIPKTAYSTIMLQSTKKIECWDIDVERSRGTVILFHGYSGQKSSLLDRAMHFKSMGLRTVLVDFMGSGGSEGNQTTIGYHESKDVLTAYEYVKETGESNIYLFGNSMGAVAIMKAMHDYEIHPAGVILECPFGSMYETVAARFKLMGVPAFPMADLLVFWGGTVNGFWGHGHNPTEYAKRISCPTLLMYGSKDQRVSQQETEVILTNIPGEKELVTFPQAGHENYLKKYEPEWIERVSAFMQNN